MNIRIIAMGLLFLSPCIYADEGMWLLSQLKKSTYKTMQQEGLKLDYRQLYDPSQPSLKDAVVSFGGFCSGVVVSSDGLVLTNHHCGLSSVQQHSTVEHDYLDNGFVARTRKEELPNPDLYVRFLLYNKDVTKQVLRAVRPEMTESQRNHAVDSMKIVISHSVTKKDSTLTATVDTYYGGSEFFLSVYRDYTDVRLVFAPPASVGQFGWDTDNWMWPRHTGDFCVFRIYANKDNLPSDYSEDNVPYHPAYVAPISMGGYREGTFCMTIGYPGTTQRYLSSYGVDEMVKNQDQAVINVRNIKLGIWKQAMSKNDTIRIKYASKYSECSNYWKNSIGVKQAVGNLNIIGKRSQLEATLQHWFEQHASEQHYQHLLAELHSSYQRRFLNNKAQAYYAETFFNGPDLLQMSMQILNLDFNASEKEVTSALQNLVDQYKNYDEKLDKKVFKALLKNYQSSVDTTFLPELYKDIARQHISIDAYVDSLYRHTELTSLNGIKRFLNRDSTYNLSKDPAILLSTDLIVKFLELGMVSQKDNDMIEKDERLLTAAIRRMNDDRQYYPDANSTMRLSYGTVCSYQPKDGVKYDYHTTAQGILQKVKSHEGDRDFRIKPGLLDLINKKDYGPYADKSGQMNVCFISNNDITGGNSGSAMFNGNGQLVGLAFDGNWEAMSSDLNYNPQLQRCIGVDIRYVLFLIDKYGKATHILNEMELK